MDLAAVVKSITVTFLSHQQSHGEQKGYQVIYTNYLSVMSLLCFCVTIFYVIILFFLGLIVKPEHV